MAIVKSVQLHPSSAVPAVPAAYLMIGEVRHNRLTGIVTLGLVCFASADERATYKAAAESVEESRPVFEAGDQADKIVAAADATAEEKAAVWDLKSEATLAFLAAKASLERAQVRLNAIRPLVPMLPLEVSLPREAAADCMTDGRPDVKKLYAWLATQPGFGGAET